MNQEAQKHKDSPKPIQKPGTKHQPSDANDPTNKPSYVLVTPVRNEEEFIGRTINSVVNQTIRPVEWLIVSDGSTDQTDAIIALAIEKNPWIRTIQLPPRTKPSWTAVVDNTTLGINSLKSNDYQFLGLLDSDLEFQSDYFEQLLDSFEKDPELGLTGGVAIDIGRPKTEIPRNKSDVPGALQFYRRTCFEESGGLQPIPEGGWDGVSCAMARKAGWKTRLATHLIVDHLKPRNVSEGNLLKRRWQMGTRDYAIGYHPLFEIIKCASRIGHHPAIIGSACWWLGYCTALVRCRKRILSKEVVNHIRKEQLQRIFKN